MINSADEIDGLILTYITGNNNAYLTKRKSGGGVQFSRDPLNLTNKHSRKHAGFVNDEAIGIQADDNTVRLFPSFQQFSLSIYLY